jgi:hypothetical protein
MGSGIGQRRVPGGGGAGGGVRPRSMGGAPTDSGPAAVHAIGTATARTGEVRSP